MIFSKPALNLNTLLQHQVISLPTLRLHISQCACPSSSSSSPHPPFITHLLALTPFLMGEALLHEVGHSTVGKFYFLGTFFFFFNVDKRSVISETTILASDDHMRDRFTIEKKASDLQETHTTEGMRGSLYF